MIIMFTDIESSTEITQALGDESAHKLVEAHDQIVAAAVEAGGGKLIKHTGDGIMAALSTATKAVQSAKQIQMSIRKFNEGQPTKLTINIGINAGEPISKNNDLFGSCVQLAARICDYAGGGKILLSDTVWHLLAGKKYDIKQVGYIRLKGFDEPARLHELIV